MMLIIITTQSVKNLIHPLVPTCFLHDLAGASEQQSCPSLFADWQEPMTKKGEVAQMPMLIIIVI